ncbi:hypothetical protein D3C75_920910 [compost metagenome]
MTTRQRNSGLLAYKTPTFNDFTRDFWCQGVNRPAKNGDSHNRFAAHRIDITDRVGSSNAPKIERIVDDRHKEVSGADDTSAVAQIVYRRVITGFVSYQ